MRDAVKSWEEKSGQKASEAEQVLLYGWVPPIEKMDTTVSQMKNCKRLALSTNCIDRIGGLQGLVSLEILSLARNQIKRLENLDAVAPTLEQLWLSYNNLTSLAGVEKLKKLKVLYCGNNKISSWSEIDRLKDLPDLEEILLTGNPLEKNTKDAGENWRIEVLRRLPSLKKLDGRPFDLAEREQAEGVRKDMGE